MLGAGHKKPERLVWQEPCDPEPEWVRLDMNNATNPDILFNLDSLGWRNRFNAIKLPVAENSFDEIHAYEVLEHVGKQGDYQGFFQEFREYWRILKPGGILFGTTPAMSSPWLWGDPGHTRVINKEVLSFLTPDVYSFEDTAISDYRHLVDPCWWKLVHAEEKGNRFTFGLLKHTAKTVIKL